MRLWSAHPPIDHDRIVAAIVAAERNTSGEIRVVIGRGKAADPVAAARRHFAKLGMHRTRERNAVLLFLAPRSRTFAIYGDTGVHERCGDAFWQEVAAAMTAHFKRGEFTSGLLHGIVRAGALLAKHFPSPPEEGSGRLADGAAVD